MTVAVNGADVSAISFMAVADPTTFTISGVAGTPGATVTLSGAASASTTADASGNFSFSGMHSGSYTVTPNKSGYNFSPASQGATVNGANITVPAFAASAIPQTFSISGTISGSGGNGATVSLSGAASTVTTANGSGGYSFTGLANGSYTVTASHSGFTFSPVSQNATVSGANVTVPAFTATAVAPQTFSISGTISGSGGNGATVSLSGAATASTTADSSGSYSFSGLANGSYTVTPSHSGFTFSPVSQNATLSAANVTVPAFTATAQTFSISGTISGSGGNGGTVTLSGAASASTTANSSGGYTFTGLSNGSYTVAASHSGFTFSPASQNAAVSGANVTVPAFTATAVAPQTFSISGTISGSGGNGATVTLSGAASASTTANSSGNYSFTGLANGSYTVTASHSGFTFSPASQNAAVSGANVTVPAFTATAVAPQTFSISGTISGSGGNGATVTLSGASSATTTANSSGSYTFTGLANGSYTVTPSHSGFTFSPTSQNATVSGNNVTVPAFTATAQTFSISGTISGSGGNGATIALSGTSSATTTASSSGSYTFTGLANGSYTVTPSNSGFTFSPGVQSISISGSNVTVPAFTATSAAPTFSISGTVTPAATGSGATVTLSGAASATTTVNSSGDFTFTALANGSYTVAPSSASATFSPASQNVTISGANGSVSFTATATASSSNGPAGPWTYTGGDEFNGTSLNTALWGTQYTFGCTNNDELEGYEPGNVTESGGLLTLAATHVSNSCSGGKSYSSGMVESGGKFSQLYGYFEARIQVPAYQGFWPAFWLMPENGAWPPEIDVIELGESGDFNTARMTNHYGPSGSGSYDSQTWYDSGTPSPFGSGLHTFAVDWEPGSLAFYIDGTLRATISAPSCPTSGSVGGSGSECISAVPMYVLANLAIGGSYTGGVGGSTPFPSNMTVDYIRVYQRDSNGCYATIPGPSTTPSATCTQ